MNEKQIRLFNLGNELNDLQVSLNKPLFNSFQTKYLIRLLDHINNIRMASYAFDNELKEYNEWKEWPPQNMNDIKEGRFTVLAFATTTAGAEKFWANKSASFIEFHESTPFHLLKWWRQNEEDLKSHFM